MSAGAGVAHAVGGDQGEPEAGGEVEGGAVAVLLVAEPVALQLDVEAAGEEGGEAFEEVPRGVEAAPTGGEGVRQRPLLAAGQAVEPLGVRGDQLPARPRLPLRPAAGGGGQQLAEVAVAGAVADEQGQAGEAARGVAGGRWPVGELRPGRFGHLAGLRPSSSTTSAPTSARSPASRAAL